MFVKQAVSCLEHAELGTAVEGVARVLLALRQMLDKVFREHVALLEEGVPLSKLARNRLGLELAVAAGYDAVFCYAVGGEIVDDCLSTVLGETLIVFLRAAIITVAAQLDGNTGILLLSTDRSLLRKLWSRRNIS